MKSLLENQQAYLQNKLCHFILIMHLQLDITILNTNITITI